MNASNEQGPRRGLAETFATSRPSYRRVRAMFLYSARAEDVRLRMPTLPEEIHDAARRGYVQGGCYCGQVRYEAEGDPAFRGQCFCRECQYLSGGDSVLVMAMPEAGFRVTKGALKPFRRSDLPKPVTRELCPNCGTHLTTRAMPGLVMLGDDASTFIFARPNSTTFTKSRSVPTGSRMMFSGFRSRKW